MVPVNNKIHQVIVYNNKTLKMPLDEDPRERSSIEVSKETYESLKKIFGVVGLTGSCFGTIYKTIDNPALNERHTLRIKFMTHQEPYYWLTKNSLKYMIYVSTIPETEK